MQLHQHQALVLLQQEDILPNYRGNKVISYCWFRLLETSPWKPSWKGARGGGYHSFPKVTTFFITFSSIGEKTQPLWSFLRALLLEMSVTMTFWGFFFPCFICNFWDKTHTTAVSSDSVVFIFNMGFKNGLTFRNHFHTKFVSPGICQCGARYYSMMKQLHLYCMKMDGKKQVMVKYLKTSALSSPAPLVVMCIITSICCTASNFILTI